MAASSKAVNYITSHAWNSSRLGLERTEELLKRLGNPEEKLKFVHVAGTNGKGSVCAMLSSILTESGYKTGLYTSPYINRFNERIQIDKTSISDDDLIRITEKVKAEADKMADHPTEFELITVIAFEYFFESNCDIVVLEVGLGGRLDATNAVPVPEACAITPISFDHVLELGDTLEKIAVEKAGIIKSGGCVVSSPQPPGVEQTLADIAARRNANISFISEKDIHIISATMDGQRFNYKHIKDLFITLLGTYQPQNAAVVIALIEALRRKGWDINENSLRAGLAKAKWPARFEIIKRQPWFIVDGGHNPQCVDCLVDCLNTYFPGKKISFITGVMADKDFNAMFGKIIPLAGRIFTVTPDNPRALPASELARFFLNNGVGLVEACGSVEDGVKKALKAAGDDEIICAFGSFYMAGSIRNMLGLDS